MTAFNFDATKVEPDQGRVGAMPKGWYKTMVESTELKPTSNGNGQFVSVMFGVVEGPHKGSKFFNNFNVVNESEKAVEIGHKQFSALLHAVGVLVMTNTDQIKNIPFFTRLKFVAAEMDPQEPTKIKYEEKNEPTAYRNINDQTAIEAIARQAAAPAVGAAPSVPLSPPPQAMQAPQQAWTPPANQQPAMQQPQQQYQPQQQQPQQQQTQWQPPSQPQPWDPNAGQQAAQQYSASPAPGQMAQPAPMQQQQYQPQQQPVQQLQQYQPQQQQFQQQQQSDPNAPPPWVHPQQ